MSALTEGFKECAHQSGSICSFPTGKLLRTFGLEDFLENRLTEEDDAPTIAVKALAYFCEGIGPRQEAFKFAVLAVGLFLNSFHAERKGVPQQALQDLVPLLVQAGSESQIRQWIKSHFG